MNVKPELCSEAVEDYIDRRGLTSLLDMIATICAEKAGRFIDDGPAEKWQNIAARLEVLAASKGTP